MLVLSRLSVRRWRARPFAGPRSAMGVSPRFSRLPILLAVFWLTTLAAADEVVPFDPALPAKSRCQVAIQKLRPTQFAVGFREVDERAENIARKSPKKLNAYLEEHLALIVIGPDDVPYLIDGHHLCLAMLKAKVGDAVVAQVEANWRRLGRDDFWRQMREHRWVYPYDNQGRGPLDPEAIPKTVTEMTDDPYRSLAWEVRKRGGYKKTADSFAEFKWANFFRARIPVGDGEGGFQRAIEAALNISHSAEAKGLPGYMPPG
jgi:hypothetical protein